jgi:hypothetical protein
MTFRSLLLAAAVASIAIPASARAQAAYVPGDRVLFEEDFAPADSALRRLRSVSPRIRAAAREGRPFLHARTPSSFEVPLAEALPERFTIDYDFFIPGINQVWVTFLGRGGEARGSVACGPHTLNFSNGQGDDRVEELDERPIFGGNLEERVNRCAIAVDGGRVSVWVNGVLAAEEEGLALGRTDRLRVHFEGVEDPTLLDQNIPVWLANLRIAAVTQR